MINIAIIEDHKLLANTLSYYLKSQTRLNVVSINNDAASFLQIVEDKDVDVAIIDISLPNMDGTELCGILKKNYPKIKVIGYSLYNSKDYLDKMLNQGADAYILKDDNVEEITNAIYAVNEDLSYYSQSVFPLFKKNSRIVEPENKLSKRQIEIAKLIAEGASTKAIAAILNITEATISTHRNNIMKKLNVHNVAGIIRFVNQRK